MFEHIKNLSLKLPHHEDSATQNNFLLTVLTDDGFGVTDDCFVNSLLLQKILENKKLSKVKVCEK